MTRTERRAIAELIKKAPPLTDEQRRAIRRAVATGSRGAE